MTTTANADSTSNIQSSESRDGLGALKKSRRQTAFYPNTQTLPSNPFSKSAAKRDSVLALGSIEHLQHYFTKAGLASKRKPAKVKGLVPALGPSIIPTLEISGLSSSASSIIELPPSPVVQTVSRPPYPQVERVYPQTDPDALKPGLIRDLEETEKAWSIGVDPKEKVKAPPGPQLLTASNIKKQTENSFEVLVGSSGGGDVPLSVSDEFLSTTGGRAPTPPRSLGSGRSSAVTATTDRRGSGIFSGLEDDDNESATSASAAGSGGSASRRESSTATKLLPKPGVTTAFVPLRGNGATIQVWVDEEDELLDDPLESPKPKKEAWDERLVLGGGWLYKQASPSDLGEQRAVVERYLDIVDEASQHLSAAYNVGCNSSALFGAPPSSWAQTPQYRRGWQRVKASLPTPSRLRRSRSSLGPSPSNPQSPTESEVAGPSASSGVLGGPKSLRRVSSNGILPNILSDALVAEPEDSGGDMLGDLAEGDEEEEDGEFEDGELAEWARRDRFADDVLARLWAILSAHLPSQLLGHLPSYTSSADREALLIRLSDGQLLCHAYNAV
ncbi:hypothetical protein FRC01_004966, partial [Tulasnella sp. 417]